MSDGDFSPSKTHHHHSRLANKFDPRVKSSSSSHESLPPEEQPKNTTDHSEELSEDPNIVKSSSTKLTGTAFPGSHSALFGLTPDGHIESAASYRDRSGGSAHQAQSEEYSTSTNAATSGDGDAAPTAEEEEKGEASVERAWGGDRTRDIGGAGTVDGGVGNRAPGGEELRKQMHDPRINQTRIQGTGEPDMPGSGGSTMSPSQGFGEVGSTRVEEAEESGNGGLLDKARNMFGSGSK